MAFSVQMPELGESVTEGTVTRWLKQEGDRVEVDEPLLEVSTDKVDTEIPSPAAGVLERIVAGEDETIEVGGELAVIGDGGAGRVGGDARPTPAPTGRGGGRRSRTTAEPDVDAQDSGGDTPSSDAVEAPSRRSRRLGAPAPEQGRRAGRGASDADAEPSGSGSGRRGPGRVRVGGGSGTPVTMPELGESVTEGTITRWLKEVGDEVAADEPLLEVSTDKVDTEIPSPIAGTLLEITADEDETVDVGGQLAVIGDAGGPAGAESSRTPSSAEPGGERRRETPAAEREPAPADQQPVAEAARPAEQPSTEAVASRRAERARGGRRPPAAPPGGDGKAVGDRRALRHPAGPQAGGRARRGPVDDHRFRCRWADPQAGRPGRGREAPNAAEPERPAPEPRPARRRVRARRAAAAAKPAADGPQPGTTVKMPRLRQVIAQRMSESLRVSAQLTTVQEVDVTRIAQAAGPREGRVRAARGRQADLPAVLRQGHGGGTQGVPAGQRVDQRGVAGRSPTTAAVHLAIAVDTPRGLLVPVVKNAEDLNLAGLAKRIADVAARTRDNKIGPDELSGGTFTITNIGSAGALFDTPIINQPQVAILGTGAISKQPAVITGPDGDDVIAVRSLCYLPLTYDHRLVDGADAGRFVSASRRGWRRARSRPSSACRSARASRDRPARSAAG